MMNKRKMIINRVLLYICLKLPVFAFPQKGDTLEGLRQFVKICSSYQTIPLHASIAISKSADIITSPEDTFVSMAEFYILKEGTYIKMDGMEQVVNDSLMLFISGADKRMILYANNTSVTEQLRRSFGLYLQDSSLEKIAKKYTATLLPDDEHGNAAVELKSRAFIGNTTLPKEAVLVTCGNQSRLPKEVLQISRKLVPLSKEEYKDMQLKDAYRDKLISSEDKYFFLVKTHTVKYTYQTMNHDPKTALPLKIDACVARNSNGQYAPVKAYEGYGLTENL